MNVCVRFPFLFRWFVSSKPKVLCSLAFYFQYHKKVLHISWRNVRFAFFPLALSVFLDIFVHTVSIVVVVVAVVVDIGAAI